MQYVPTQFQISNGFRVMIVFVDTVLAWRDALDLVRSTHLIVAIMWVEIKTPTRIDLNFTSLYRSIYIAYIWIYRVSRTRNGQIRQNLILNECRRYLSNGPVPDFPVLHRGAHEQDLVLRPPNCSYIPPCVRNDAVAGCLYHACTVRYVT